MVINHLLTGVILQVPQNGWFISWKTPMNKWMILGGKTVLAPIFGKYPYVPIICHNSTAVERENNGKALKGRRLRPRVRRQALLQGTLPAREATQRRGP